MYTLLRAALAGTAGVTDSSTYCTYANCEPRVTYGTMYIDGANLVTFRNLLLYQQVTVDSDSLIVRSSGN